ncbi:MAG: hypothetical protein Q9191_005748 [Dirinaria sp. TL-2023a]
MTSIPKILRTMLLLILPLPTLQVDIAQYWWFGGMKYFQGLITVRWNNVPPGTCCKPAPWQLPSLENHSAGVTRFFDLLQNQFGAGWAATGTGNQDIINCTGAPILRVFGPTPNEGDSIDVYNPPAGQELEGAPQNVVFAASWIDLRVRFPPNSAGSRYLGWQGVNRAVWGKDAWNAGSNGVPFPRKKRSRYGTDRLNSYAQQGTAYISAPARWAYPSVYTTNGTDYMDQGNGTYVNKYGTVLDLESFGGR